MSDNANTEGQDVFDDTSAGGDNAAGATDTNTAGAGEGAPNTDTKANDNAGEGNDVAGAGKAAATENQDDPEIVVDAKTGQKMIPEHRFKAALKKVTDDLDTAKGKLSEYEKPKPIPVPDKDVDPEGHDLHVRMEASKAVMMDLRDDYQDVINHYATMAESNPLLNQAVAKHPIPAKLAYDIAKKDLEIKEALAVKGSDEWKEFQEFKKSKTTNAAQTEESKLASTVNKGLRPVPNLNRSTNASPNRNVRKNSNGSSDDDLFAGAL